MGPVPVPPRHLSDSFGGQEGNYGRSLPFRVFLPQVPPRFKSPPAQEDQTNCLITVIGSNVDDLN